MIPNGRDVTIEPRAAVGILPSPLAGEGITAAEAKKKG
jgi:hypothetical protein